MRILGISGSLRAASYNTALLRAAAALAPEGVEFELLEGLELLPPYNEDLDTEDPHSEVVRVRDAITSADAVLFSTPEFNGTMPGQMKQVVDWGSRPHGAQSALWGKPVAVIGASATARRRVGGRQGAGAFRRRRRAFRCVDARASGRSAGLPGPTARHGGLVRRCPCASRAKRP